MTEQTFTDEQEAILEAAESTTANLMIPALAGCGKTSTLEAIEGVVPKQPILYMVFNKKNATEAEGRLTSTTTVRTFNSMGHRVWAATQAKRLAIEPKKTYNIFRELVDKAGADHRQALWSVYSQVADGVSMAKSLGYIPGDAYPSAKRLLTRPQFHNALDEVPDDLTADVIDAILAKSIRQSYEGLLDYNDQVYMPALFGGVFPKFPLTLVDEYQDLSPVNHMLLERVVKGRLIGVGDPWQNIYGFRGARAKGMDEAAVHYGCQSLPLSTSFRCPSAIVRNVHWRVPHFKWTTDGGKVEKPVSFSVDDFIDDSTVLCRNNAPLLACAFRLLGAGRSISVAGSDIGPRLIAVMKKLGDGSMGRTSMLIAIAEWEADKLAKESKSASDMAACMRIFAEHGTTLDQALAYADHLFKQQGRIYLSTIHKAKGLEWERVYFLDPWLVRKNATDQDKNLDYVASTRSRHTLIEIDSERIVW